MPRLLIVAFTVALLTPAAASAYGRSCYYSYSSDQSASYTSKSNDKPSAPAASPTVKQ